MPSSKLLVVDRRLRVALWWPSLSKESRSIRQWKLETLRLPTRTYDLSILGLFIICFLAWIGQALSGWDFSVSLLNFFKGYKAKTNNFIVRQLWKLKVCYFLNCRNYIQSWDISNNIKALFANFFVMANKKLLIGKGKKKCLLNPFDCLK